MELRKLLISVLLPVVLFSGCVSMQAIAELEPEIAGLEQQIADLENTNRELRDQNSDLRDAQLEMQEKADSLEARYQELCATPVPSDGKNLGVTDYELMANLVVCFSVSYSDGMEQPALPEPEIITEDNGKTSAKYYIAGDSGQRNSCVYIALQYDQDQEHLDCIDITYINTDDGALYETYLLYAADVVAAYIMADSCPFLYDEALGKLADFFETGSHRNGEIILEQRSGPVCSMTIKRRDAENV